MMILSLVQKSKQNQHISVFARSSTRAAVGPFDLLSMTWELIKWQKRGGLSIPTRRRYSCSSSRHCWNAKPCLPFSQVPWTHYCGARSLLSMLGGISMWNFIQFLAFRLNLDVGKDCPWIEDLLSMGLVETFIVCLGPILVLFSALSWLAYYYYYYLGWPQRESIDLADTRVEEGAYGFEWDIDHFDIH